jgi:iron complex outermembrane receptor protein
LRFLPAVLFLTIPLFGEDGDLLDGSLEDILSMESELKVDVGSRDDSRNFLESRSPVDVITSEQIDRSGYRTLPDILRYFVAGFNAQETSIADGSGYVRVYTLRGMSPDQILVLVNGKRLHTSALLHVNNVIGRGSSHVDLEMIPVEAVETIEVLRDGAAAQYGSDAISGVINIKLKSAHKKNMANFVTGQRVEGDGFHYHGGVFLAKELPYDGFLNLALSTDKQEKTQRGGDDRRIDPPEVKSEVGLPETDSFSALANIELPLKSGEVVYSNLIGNYRESSSSAFYRTPDEERTFFPDGFLPIMDVDIGNYSATTGVRGEFDSIQWDLSNVFGYSNFHFFMYDTVNYSLGHEYPRTFDNGELKYTQDTVNLDLKTKLFESIDLASGFEFRYENYEIVAGEEDSYMGNKDSLFAAGSQGFAGYQPANEVDRSRNSFSLYINTVYNFSDSTSLEEAIRHESYSDFGSTNNFKISLGHKFVPEVLWRTSVSTGFRAPSLSQSSYSHTSFFTDSETGKLVSKGFVRPDSPAAKLFVDEDLKPEYSEHFNSGFVYQPTNKSSIMIDYFLIRVYDRILISPDYEATTDEQKQFFEDNGVAQIRFFINASNTRTEGFDLKANHVEEFDGSKLEIGFWYNLSKTELIVSGDSGGFEQIDRIENGQPQQALRLLTHYQIDKADATLNISRHSTYNQVMGDVSYEFDPAWIVDLDLQYEVMKDIKIALGGHNIFDSYPNKWDRSDEKYGYDGIKPYSRYSPYGYSGAYYYLRASAKF